MKTITATIDEKILTDARRRLQLRMMMGEITAIEKLCYQILLQNGYIEKGE